MWYELIVLLLIEFKLVDFDRRREFVVLGSPSFVTVLFSRLETVPGLDLSRFRRAQVLQSRSPFPGLVVVLSRDTPGFSYIKDH